ncbi:MAG: hypothetical protein R2834_17235 [Rhodothermales bacterium]
MTPEEFDRIKQAEKEHLRALKKLKEQVRSAERLQTINRALKEMQDAPGEDILRTHDEMIEKLALETVRHEVKLDMALSEAAEQAEADEQNAVSEAEMEKLRAQSLIRQVKIEMGLEDAGSKQDPPSNVAHPQTKAEASSGGTPPANPTPTTKTGTEKTIGRLRK